MTPFRPCVCVLSSCVLAFLLAGCRSSDPAPGFGDWTLQQDGLTLTEDVHVSETDAFYFGSLGGLDVTADGRMVVADRSANHIKILRPAGTLLDTLGRSGEGPGEFQRLLGVQVARGDSLYAFDTQQSRLTVFGPDSPYEVARTTTLSREGGYPFQVQVLDDHVVAEYAAASSPEEDVSRSSPHTWKRVQTSGAPGDTVLPMPGPLMIMAETNNTVQLRGVPLSPGTSEAWGPNGWLYHGWTDSLHVEARSLDGSSEVIASIPTEPVPLTGAARDSLLDGISGEMRSKMAAALPDTKPAFMKMVVADDGRLWVRRPRKGPDAQAPWWMLDPETKTIREVRLPPQVNLRVVRNGYAYGSTHTETGAPAVVRYKIQRTT